jgi:hypothetical protein
MPIISQSSGHPRVLSILAAVGGLLPQSGTTQLERSARLHHERAARQGVGWHPHFRFEHCPENVCEHARELKEALCSSGTTK